MQDKILSRESFSRLYLKLVTHTPDGGNFPGIMILNFFPETFDVYIHGAGVPDIFIALDLIQKLFPGENMVGRGGQKI